MILVTGADGFVGRHIVVRLARDGDAARAMVRNIGRARKTLMLSDMELVEGDTTKPATLPPALEGVDTIIHCAFIVANRKQGPGVNYYETNVRGTNNLVDAAKTAGVRHVCVMGGLGTRSGTGDTYVQQRYEANQAIKESGLGWSILGPSVQFGEGSPFITGLADLIRSAPVVPMIGNGKRLFQPIWVEDVTTCILKMAHEPERYAGVEVDIGGPEVFSYAQILDLLMRKMGKKKLKVPGPKPLARLGAAMMEAVLPKPPITRAAMGLFDFDNVAALDSVQRTFGFAPLSFRVYLEDHALA